MRERAWDLPAAHGRQHWFDDPVGKLPQRQADRRRDQRVGSRANEIVQQIASGGEIEYAREILGSCRRRARRLASAHHELDRPPDLRRVTAEGGAVFVQNRALAAGLIDIVARGATCSFWTCSSIRQQCSLYPRLLVAPDVTLKPFVAGSDPAA
jgi:hypothetical protein